uniref:Uncharacterized protein n=1 Tax=Glossina palpalis gambiensis TaxID=67801 RepID=A0A1B0BPN7_9MUSC
MLVRWMCDNIPDSNCAGFSGKQFDHITNALRCAYKERRQRDENFHKLFKFTRSAFLELKQVEPSASIASVLTDLANVPTVNSENRKSADMLFNHSVPAGQGREIPSTGLKVENANVRAAADTPIDDILQFMSVKNTGITNCPISTFQFNYKQPRK